MDWKVITINVFYVQLLKVGFCSNDDKSVPNIFLCFSASIQMVLIFLICCFSENHQIFMKIVGIFLSMPKQCTGIPALKITLAHKCIISDVIWHTSVFSLVTSSPGGSYMSDQVKIILEHNAA